MQLLNHISIIHSIQILSLIYGIKSNEIIGCGGFIKCHIDIDYSKVEIKLFTKQGVLKDTTDCSPSNGYYFLPIYDKGDYVLRVVPPHGWSFEPVEVKLNFDGETDLCSQGKDINFMFKGFGITGKVVLYDKEGNLVGAQGVKVILKHLSNENLDERVTLTDNQGVFSFTPIIPGKYILNVHHAKWHFNKPEHIVEVKEGNTELSKDAFIISGFDITGYVDTTNHLPSGIWLTLYNDKFSNHINGDMCKANSHFICNIEQHVDRYNSKAFKYTKVDRLGNYTFQNIPPGSYMLVPISENQELKIHWKPKQMELEVVKDFINIETKFKIDGFSISGKVLRAFNGPPLSNAIVKLNNGRIVAITNEYGIFTLSHIPSPGIYTIQVEAAQLLFPSQKVLLDLSTSTLAPLIPTEYEVCGMVSAKNLFQISINGVENNRQNIHKITKTNPDTGTWCTYLPPGDYSIEVLTTDKDKKNSVQFHPSSRNIKVTWNPIKDIIFTELRATIKGALECLADAPSNLCLKTEIALNSLNKNGETTGQVEQKTKASNGIYVFENILPGRYEVSIICHKLCFNIVQRQLNVKSVTEFVPIFKQHGYEINIISSHKVMLKYHHVSTPDIWKTVKLLNGLNTFCVEKYGVYNIQLEGCHSYDPDKTPKSFNTADQSSLVIDAVAHKVGFRFLLPEDLSTEDFQIYVESAMTGKKWLNAEIETDFIDKGMIAYKYETQLKPYEVLRVTPHGEVLIFEPATKTIVGTNDCVDVALHFQATRGITLEGKTVPPVNGAVITLNFPYNPEMKQQTVLTGENGTFKFATFPNHLKYELTGEKESYVFSPYNQSTSTFYANKLSEITVHVRDDTDNPLSGVLISISGDESYRKNILTPEEGRITFHSLTPSQYFIKPLMKEFKFEPNSKMIRLQNGENVDINMIGTKIAYSVFGSITTLNGEPYPKLNIEANSNELCSHHQEEATSEMNGQYRLRGLQPNCTYKITVRSNDHMNTIIDHSIPSKHNIEVHQEDVHGIDFIGIPRLTYTDVIVRVTASTNDYYKLLSVCMYRMGSYDNPIYLQRLDAPHKPKIHYNPGIMVFLPRIPLNNKTVYVVELRTTLSRTSYDYTTTPKEFIPDRGTIFIEFNFAPTVRSTDAELNQNSFSVLLLIVLVATVYFKQDIAGHAFEFVWFGVNYVIRELSNRSKDNNKNNNTRKADDINQKEIEQIAEQINSMKKKRVKKI